LPAGVTALDLNTQKNKVSLDHVVIIVNDLNESIKNFRELGFQVQIGGVNGPVHNALIFFKDGTYIELTTPISFKVRGLFKFLYSLGLLTLLEKIRPGLTPRFLFWFGGPIGLKDMCLRCDDLDKSLNNMAQQGMDVTPAQSFSRQRADGEVASWRLGGPIDRTLPFLIEDLTPVEVRVPFKEACEHTNGVLGISAIVMEAHNAKQLIERIQPSLGNTPNKDYAANLCDVKVRNADEAPVSHLALELLVANNTQTSLPMALTSNAAISLVGAKRAA